MDTLASAGLDTLKVIGLLFVAFYALLALVYLRVRITDKMRRSRMDKAPRHDALFVPPAWVYRHRPNH